MDRSTLHCAALQTAYFSASTFLTYLHTFLCRESILFKHTDEQFVHLSVVWCVQKGHSGLSTMQQLDPCWPLAYVTPRYGCLCSYDILRILFPEFYPNLHVSLSPSSNKSAILPCVCAYVACDPCVFVFESCVGAWHSSVLLMIQTSLRFDWPCAH